MNVTLMTSKMMVIMTITVVKMRVGDDEDGHQDVFEAA
jgi:hypothetical protein